ncbi:hypothetical protein [Clostridium aceticum]|nr:hypothetical protein [Clostridium aceticum]
MFIDKNADGFLGKTHKDEGSLSLMVGGAFKGEKNSLKHLNVLMEERKL